VTSEALVGGVRSTTSHYQSRAIGGALRGIGELMFGAWRLVGRGLRFIGRPVVGAWNAVGNFAHKRKKQGTGKAKRGKREKARNAPGGTGAAQASPRQSQQEEGWGLTKQAPGIV
jgi:hypothetical protein